MMGNKNVSTLRGQNRELLITLTDTARNVETYEWNCITGSW